MAGVLTFAVSYAFYVFTYIKSGVQVVYPLYLAPLAVLFYAAVLSFMLAKITRLSFLGRFLRLSKIMAVFIILLAVPLFIKLNLPDPHNFLQRKLELLLGASYALYLLAGAAYFIFSALKAVKPEKLEPGRAAGTVFAFAFIFYFSVTLWFNYAVQPTGDEPSYLLVSHSMLYDRDLDLKNNYDNRDYMKFYSKNLEPQGTDIKRDGKILSYHPVLLSAIIAPFYLAGGRFGVTLLTSASCAALACLIFMFLFKMTGSMRSSLATTAVTAFTMPVIGFANNISTEIFITLIILYSYYLIKYEPEKTILTAFVMALSVWMHIRSIPVYASLCLIFAWHNRKNIPAIIKFGAIQAASVLLFFAFNYIVLGSILPSYAEGGGSNLQRFNPANMLAGMAAFFMDRQLGLFSYAPAYVFILAGVVMLFKKYRKEFVEMSLIFAPYFIMICSWSDWGGGSSSPRYLIQVIFVLSACLAVFFDSVRPQAASLPVHTAFGLSAAFTAAVACVPWFRWDRPFMENPILSALSKMLHFDLTVFFPSFYLGGNTIITAAIWAALILAANFIAARGAKK